MTEHFIWVSKVVWDCFGFELLCTVIGRVTSSTNQIQNWNQSWLGHSRFPALLTICSFNSEFSLVCCDIHIFFWLAVVITLILV